MRRRSTSCWTSASFPCGGTNTSVSSPSGVDPPAGTPSPAPPRDGGRRRHRRSLAGHPQGTLSADRTAGACDQSDLADKPAGNPSGALTDPPRCDLSRASLTEREHVGLDAGGREGDL